MSAYPQKDRGLEVSSDRLRLRPKGQLFEISAERLQISFANHTATFTGLPVVKGILALLKALENGGERSAVVGHLAQETELEPAFLEYLIDLLLKTACL